jgi:hypothetical protein
MKGEGDKEPSQDDDEDASDSCGSSCERDAGIARDSGTVANLDAGASDGGSSATMDAGRDAAADAGSSNVDASGGPTNDAGGRDANADTGLSMCAMPGQSCEATSCCTGAVCVIAPETGSSICAAQCNAPSQCNSNCCVPIRGGNTSACVPASNCSVTTGPVGGGCRPLQVIAEDGTYLGDATSNTVAPTAATSRLRARTTRLRLRHRRSCAALAARSSPSSPRTSLSSVRRASIPMRCALCSPTLDCESCLLDIIGNDL